MGSSPSSQPQPPTMQKPPSPKPCLILYNKTNLLHKSSRPHPQCPSRLQSILHKLETLIPTIPNAQLLQIQQGKGSITKQQVQKLLVQLHGEGYVEFVREMWHDGIKKSQMFINIDTYFMRDTYFVAVEAARTVLIAACRLADGADLGSAYAVVRPPGHHSGLKSQPHGFSFFNNIGLAAYHLIATKRAKKIAIVDWDIHHGQGTQKLFYNRNDILFISVHRHDLGKFFPHIPQSSSQSTGKAEGLGHNINICWNLPQKPKGTKHERSQTCGNEQYIHAFHKIVLPVLKEYQPDIVLISCGFDSGCGDPIGGCMITQAGYSWMLREILGVCARALLVLEGGYELQVLQWGSQAVVERLTGCVSKKIQDEIRELEKSQPNKIGQDGVNQCLKHISKYWTSL